MANWGMAWSGLMLKRERESKPFVEPSSWETWLLVSWLRYLWLKAVVVAVEAVLVVAFASCLVPSAAWAVICLGLCCPAVTCLVCVSFPPLVSA